MTYDEFRRALLVEQFAHPVPEWHPSVDDLITAAARNRLLDEHSGHQRVAS